MVAVDTLSNARWYCVRTQPRRERFAAENLRDRARIDVFAPRIRVPRRSRSGLASSVQEALFPGYIFARFDYAAQFRHVTAATGVTGIVHFGGRSPPIADHVIEALAASHTPNINRSPAPEFSAGAWVRVVEGWFRDTEGRLLSFDRGTERVRVLLSLLGCDVQVSIRAHQIVSVPHETGARFGGLIAAQTAAALVVR